MRPQNQASASRAIARLQEQIRNGVDPESLLCEFADTRPPITEAAAGLVALAEWSGYLFPINVLAPVDVSAVVLRGAKIGAGSDVSSLEAVLWSEQGSPLSVGRGGSVQVRRATSRSDWMPAEQQLGDGAAQTVRLELKSPIRLGPNHPAWVQIRTLSDQWQLLCWEGPNSRGSIRAPWSGLAGSDPPALSEFTAEEATYTPAVALLSKAGYRRRYP